LKKCGGDKKLKKIVLITAVVALALVGLGIGTVAMGQEADESTSEENSEPEECPEMRNENHREMQRAMMLNDLDGDGTPNCEDPDDDGDGINDSEDEFPHDHDNDGIPDGRDNDDDNDGIPDNEDDDYVGNCPEIKRERRDRRNHALMRWIRGNDKAFKEWLAE
jgi:hypothetical protein